METITLERNGRVFFTNVAKLVRSQDDVPTELANEWATGEANPFIKWISGNFVESDNPNQNKQFWTAGDLEIAEYTIKGAPLNMVHKVRQPVGFFQDTHRTITPTESDEDEAKEVAPFRIQALAGMWTHIFPFESALVDAADERGLLYYSMECRGTHLTCAGDQGCGETFEYMKPTTHCEHLKERASIRHIVNPTFRGGALIVPPVRPGWTGADATVFKDAVVEQACRFAEQTEDIYASAKADGADLTPSAWESLMAQIVSLSG